MRSIELSRRDFIGTCAAGTIALLGFPAVARPTSQSLLRIRKSALELSPDDSVFAQYAEAVRRMHELPETDLRHWKNQARVHADHCRHSLLDFLHWHRQYLVYFEQICGELIGDPTFALPYWDWTLGTGVIPTPFYDLQHLNVEFWKDPSQYRSPVPGGWPGTINTVGLRAIAKGVGLQSDPTRGGSFTPNRIQTILLEGVYRRFVNMLEGTPHNDAHVAVGWFGPNKVGHMGSGLSPLDPLFWLHHCNVDRLWAQWQLAGNTTPPLDETYDGHFATGKGEPATGVTSKNALDIAELGYTYEGFGDPNSFLALAGINPLNADVRESASERVLGRSDIQIQPIEFNVQTRVTVAIPALNEAVSVLSVTRDVDLPPIETIRRQGLNADMLKRFGRKTQRPRRILAHLKNVEVNVNVTPVVNVFVNCPYLAPETPYSDPHYAGSFAFFQLPQKQDGAAHHHHAESEFFIDITDAVRALGVEEQNGLTIQLMMLPPNAGAEATGTITVGSVEIIGT